MTKTSIDISKRQVTGRCDLKCAYSFSYPASVSTITNKGIYLSLSYDAATMAPVTYNTLPYAVSQIQIYSPSLHLFNGNKTAGEIVIIHSPQKGGDNLYVCIPIMVNGANMSGGSSIITDIIDQAASSVPAEGDTSKLNISDFTLQDVVPSRRPFFSYTGNNMTDDYMAAFIVYGMDAGISIAQASADKLAAIISAYEITLGGEGGEGGGLFLNDKGANTLSADQTGDLYISCEPTNTSEEVVETSTTNTNQVNYDWGSIMSNPVFRTIIIILLAILACGVVYMLLNMGMTYLGAGGDIATNAASGKN